MNLITPPKNQGQVVEVSYGWHEGVLYRRTFDRSDRTVQWEVLDDEIGDDLSAFGWSAVNSTPDVPEWAWTPCKDPEPIEAAKRDLAVLEQFHATRKA